MNRAILRLAIPNILSNVSVPLLSTFDTALMGRLSAAHIGAVGVGAMLFNFVYWNFGFLRMGSTGMTAQAFGRNDAAGMSAVLLRSLLVALLVAASLLLLQGLLGDLGLRWLQVPTAQLGLAQDYFTIRIWDAPATLALYALMGWFFGMQNAVFPLVITVVSNVINIVVSVYLVRTLGWEARGVALGTVVAQYAGLLLGIGLLLMRYRWVLPHWNRRLLTDGAALLQFVRINADIFLRTLCLTLAFGFFYSRSGAAGELVLATNVILLQYLNWMSYGVDGFAFAAESLVGRFYGAGDAIATRRAIRYSFVWGMALAAGYAVVYGLGGEGLLRIFTDQPAVIATALPFLGWMVAFPLLSTPCYLWDGVLVGLTAARTMRNTMLLALAGYLLLYWLVGRHYGNHGLWASLLAFMLLRGLLQGGWYAWRGLTMR